VKALHVSQAAASYRRTDRQLTATNA